MSRFFQRPGRPVSIVPTEDLGASPILGADGIVTASDRYGTFAPISGTAHVKGSYVELIASTTYDTSRLIITGALNLTTATGTAATDTSALMDIAIGASFETVIAANIPIGYRTTTFGITLPLFIPRGTRVGARIQSAVATKTFTGLAWATVPHDPKKPYAPKSLVTLGADTATSKGVTLTAPGSVDTKGAWTNIGSPTGQSFSGLVVCPQGDSGVAMSTTGILIDIGINTTVVVPDVAFYASAALEAYQEYTPTTFRCLVPRGAQLVGRYARDNAGNAVDLVLLGVPRRF